MHTCKTNKKVEDDNRFLGENEILMPLWGQIILKVEIQKTAVLSQTANWATIRLLTTRNQALQARF